MKINELTKSKPFYFQDLDGCLADFDKGVRAFTGGKGPDEISQKEMWIAVGDFTVKPNSSYHLILQHLMDDEVLPDRYKAMSSKLHTLVVDGLVTPDLADITDQGVVALNVLDAQQPWTIKRDFYNTLEWLPDGRQLWDYMNKKGAVILTGRPHGDWAEGQKFEWCKRELDLGKDRVLVGFAKDKAKMAANFLGRPLDGDILVDDRPQHQKAWEDAGGKWITHTSAADSIAQLEALNK